MNLRAYLSALYTGTSGRELGFHSNMLGIRGGKTWARQANRHGAFANAKILSLAAEIFRKSLEMEIRETISDKLHTKYTADEIDNYATKFLDGK